MWEDPRTVVRYNYVNLTLVKISYLLFHHLYIHKITQNEKNS